MTGPPDRGPDASTDPPLSTQLREATRVAHERTEARLAGVGSTRTIDSYARLLERWYGFLIAWQPVAAATLAAVVSPDFLDARDKLHLLRADLLALGRTDAALAALPATPADALPWHDAAGALGVLYVVEGSTLGGQLVARGAADRFGLTPTAGTAYFGSYGPDVGAMWRETKRLLDTSPDPARTVAAAEAAFEYLGEWLTGVPSPGTPGEG